MTGSLLRRVPMGALLCLSVIVPRRSVAQATPGVPIPTDATRRHLTARRATGRIVLDGRLDEPDWQTAPVAGDFAQSRPNYAPHAAYTSQVRVLFDQEHLYVGAFNPDSAGVLGQLRIPDLRRDFEPPENDVFSVTIGALGDHRTAVQFFATPLGSQADVQAFDGGDVFNFNFDALWRVRTTRSDSGYTVEMAIPWRSIRYAPGLRSWDINFLRNTRRAAQWSSWVAFPRQLSSWRLTYAGQLDSLEPPKPRTNVRVRPYVLTNSVRDRTPRAFSGSTGDVGGEVIWSPTVNSSLEATLNTDFAQADVDRQVVNLTRFSVFLPERRQFFLDNADLLNAGGLGAGNIGGIGGISGRYFVQPFFTRRIGLSDDGTPQPIDAGLRYAYRSGRTTGGALAMRTAGIGNRSGETFAVARGSQFFGRATRLGTTVAMYDGDLLQANGSRVGRQNLMVAIDGLGRIGEYTQFGGMLSTSTIGNRTGIAGTYQVFRNTPQFLVGALGALVTRDYAPQMGFVSRPDVLMTNPFVTWTLQPRSLPRSIVWIRHGPNAIAYQDPSTFTLQEANASYTGEVLFRNAASISPTVEYNIQRPLAPVSLFPNVRINPGTYTYQRGGVTLRSDQSARVAGTATVSSGSFFDGSLTRAEVSGRWSPSPYVSLRGSYEVNRLRSLGTRDSSFVTHLAGPELRMFLNPRVQWSAFYQYNTAIQRGSLNARFSWEYLPLSYLYIVYNDRQAIQGGTAPMSRSLIVKLSWLGQL